VLSAAVLRPAQERPLLSGLLAPPRRAREQQDGVHEQGRSIRKTAPPGRRFFNWSRAQVRAI